MQKSRIKIGVILSYISQFVQIGVALVYTPLMLRLLGQKEYGLYQLVFSIVSYLNLLSMGFSSSYVRFYSRYKVKNDELGLKKLNGMFVVVFTVISGLCAFVGTILIINIDTVLGNGLSAIELAKAKILMILMVINLIISFETSTFECNIIAEEKFVFQKLIIILQNILSPVVTLPLLMAGKGAIGMVEVTTFLTFTRLMVCVFYAVKENHMRFSFGKFDWILLREMWVFTFFIFINNIIDQINWSVDRFLLGRIVGTTAVAVYGVAGQLNTMYLQFSTSISNVFVPRINKLVAEKREDREISELFIRVGRIQFLVLALIISGFLIFGKQFISLWAGEGYESSFFVAVLLMVPVTVPLIQNLGIEIQRAKNKHQARSVVYLLIAIVNIFISIPLIKKMGPSGAALGTAISLIAGNIIFMNWYYSKKIGIDIVGFWKEIGKIVPSVICVGIIGIVMNIIWVTSGWIYLIIKIMIYSIAYCFFIYHLSMSKDEKIIIKNIRDRLLKK